jgi:hypothetical protein
VFCIAAYIVLAIISIFSASHRKLAKRAWDCTLRRVTFRPCDTSFKEETKSKLLSHVANRTPKLIKAADIGIEVASFVLVIATIWSILVVLESGLNLFVWGTCNPNNASSCSLSSETCSIDKTQEGLWDLTIKGKPFDWFVTKTEELGNTISNIPSRLQNWDANDYLPQNASYYYQKNMIKPTALEVIDPGCSVCAQLFKNIKSSNFENKFNLTYIAYPIKNSKQYDKYKFTNSYTITRYLEAIKINQLNTLKVPADWQIIERIFTWKYKGSLSYQTKINSSMDQQQTEELIKGWLSNIGYNNDQIKQITSDANSQKVTDIIRQNQKIVDTEIKTVKIPTIIFNGQRHEGSVKTDDLHP